MMKDLKSIVVFLNLLSLCSRAKGADGLQDVMDDELRLMRERWVLTRLGWKLFSIMGSLSFPHFNNRNSLADNHGN